MKEQAQYKSDHERLAALKPTDPEHEDQLLLRRLLLLRADRLALVDVTEAVRAAAGKASTLHWLDLSLRGVLKLCMCSLRAKMCRPLFHLCMPACSKYYPGAAHGLFCSLFAQEYCRRCVADCQVPPLNADCSKAWPRRTIGGRGGG